MVSSNKILTVSYGTFSCTAEGFEDPLAVVKETTQFFRGVVGEDRFFGAEPPQVDAELAHDLMRQQFTAEAAGGQLTLRGPLAASAASSHALSAALAAGAARQATAPMPHPAAPAADAGLPDDDTIEATARYIDPEETDDIAQTRHSGDAQPTDSGNDAGPGADTTQPHGADAESLADPAPAAQQPQKPTQTTLESVAAKLQRIRAVVETNADEAPGTDSDAAADTSDDTRNSALDDALTAMAAPQADAADNALDAMLGSLSARLAEADSADLDETLAALGAPEDAPDTAKLPDLGAALAQTRPDEDALARAASAVMAQAAGDTDPDTAATTRQPGTKASGADELYAKDLDADDVYAEDLDADDAYTKDLVTADAYAEDLDADDIYAADISDTFGRAEPDAQDLHASAAAELTAPENTEATDLYAEDLATHDPYAAADPQDPDQTLDQGLDDDWAEFASSAPARPDSDDLPDTDTDLDSDPAPQPPAAASAPPLRARVVKVKRAVFEQAVASGQLEEITDDDELPVAETAPRAAPALRVPGAETSSLSPEEEDELARELAAVKAELDSALDDWDDEDDDADDLPPVHAARTAPAASRAQDDWDDDDDADDLPPVRAARTTPAASRAQDDWDDEDEDDLPPVRAARTAPAAPQAQDDWDDEDDADDLPPVRAARTAPAASRAQDDWDDEDEDDLPPVRAARTAPAAPQAQDDWDDEDDEDDDWGAPGPRGAAAPLRLDNPVSAPRRDWPTDLDDLDAKARRASAEVHGADAGTRRASRHEDAEDDIDDSAFLEGARKAVKMASPARAMLTEQRVEDNDTSRILDQTNSELEEPEGNRRRSAIAHLRAAVAATRADRLLGRGRNPEAEAEPYREDLANVVRPRRPQPSAARSDRPTEPTRRPTPLKLVAEQRIGLADAPAATPTAPVQPRRVNRAIDTELDGRPPISGSRPQEPVDPAMGAGFADYARRVGASDLPDLVEAAAAFITFELGHSHFSRPQLMSTLRQAEIQESSREDRLRLFGKMLREGKIEKTTGGRFTVSDSIRFKPRRAAG